MPKENLFFFGYYNFFTYLWGRLSSIIMNKIIVLFTLLLSCLCIYGNDPVFVDRIWTERQTIFINEAQVDSIMSDSVMEYRGIGCGYGRCVELYFFRNHRFRRIDGNCDTLHGIWKLEGELLTIRYDRKYKGYKRKCRFIIKYKEKNYPTLFLFSRRYSDCYIFCNYKESLDTRGTVWALKIICLWTK